MLSEHNQTEMTPSPYVSRINQIDAAQLDAEIYKVLKNETKEITRYSAPGKIDKWQPEIDALLKLLIWRFSLQRGTSTFGQRLLNLHYADLDRKKAVLYLIASVLPQYLTDKLANAGDLSARSVLARKLKTLVDGASNAIALLELVNLLLFLHRGVQPRVIELLLGLSSRSITTHRPRNIGYSYMTRELLWHGLMELFTVGVPMINFHYLKHATMRLWRRRWTRDTIRRLVPEMNASTRCAYCEDSPILPSHAGCKHIFCYYCLKAHFTAMNAFLCPKCDAELHAEDMRRYTIVASSEESQLSGSLEGVDD